MTTPKRFSVLLGGSVVAVMLLAGTVRAAPTLEMPGRPTFADIASRVRDSVVTVAAAVVDKRAASLKKKKAAPPSDDSDAEEGSNSFEGFTPSQPQRKPGEPARQFTSIGSGFIIDPSGLIVTNNHVIEGGTDIYVIFRDGTELKVDKVLGRDTKTDITLLKVTPKAGKPLGAITFGDSKRSRVGDWVLAIGNPFGLNGTVTAGILSGIGRDINAGPYDEFLQTDAAINRGNSGGPLFNTSGEVIGINTAIFSPSGGSIGLGFAIPSNTARRIIEQLKLYGETHWGSIGLRVQSVSDDLAASLGLPMAEGALIAQIDHGGAAEAAGLVEGDVIVEFAGVPIRHARLLPRVVAQTDVGNDVDVAVFRAHERKTFKIKVARLSEKAATRILTVSPARPRRQRLGRLHLQSLSGGFRHQFSIKPDIEGVVVADAGGDADEPSLHAGDVILEAAHEKVRNLEEFDARVEALRQTSRRDAVLTVAKPDGALSFVSVDLSDE